MLSELSIRDYILIEDVSIEFTSGLNVLTGETGAGKSMVVGALGLLLGKKASSDEVRPGAERAVINASFDISDICESVSELAAEFGIRVDEDEALILTREVRSDGRSVARINSQQVPVQTLRHFSERLFRIHGQNEQLELFDRDYQLAMLDNYLGYGSYERIGAAYRELRAAESELEALRTARDDSGSRLDFLNFQLEEIDGAKLVTGEDEELEREYEYLMSAESVKEAVGAANEWFESPAVQSISDVMRALRRVAHLAGGAGELYEHAAQVESAISDFSRAVSKFSDGMEFDGRRIYEIERRLDKVNNLKHKYGGSIENVIETAVRLREEIDKLGNMDFALEQAQQRLEDARGAYENIAGELTLIRREAAGRFEREICSVLSELNMPEATLRIELSDAKPSSTGSDDIDIKIATAVGRELKSIKKVVSGGELSRIMLAIQVITGGGGTMLFDEVDAGISGITASVVGEKLAALSGMVQLICITHLPQIAVFADNHILIEKNSDDKKTVTDVRKLAEGERKFEIARLAGGIERSDMTMQHSEEMLRHAAEKKKNIRNTYK